MQTSLQHTCAAVFTSFCQFDANVVASVGEEVHLMRLWQNQNGLMLMLMLN